MNDRLARALAAHQQGRFDEARSLYEEVLGIDPRRFDALNLLGALCVQTGDHGRACEWLGKAVLVDPGHAGAVYNLGLAQQELGRLDDALVSYGRALDLSPDHLEARNNRGNVLQALKQHERALADFECVIAREPRHARAHANRANALRSLGRLDDAIASCDRALALDPGYAAAWNNRGATRHLMRRLPEALADFDHAIALDPRDAQAHENRAVVLGEMLRPAEALAAARQAIALRPDRASAHVVAGEALLALGDAEAACAAFERALLIDPALDVVHGQLLGARLRHGDWTDIDGQIGRIESGLVAGRAMTPPWAWLAACGKPAMQRLAAAAWVRQRIAPAGGAPSFGAPGPRIRLGYFAATFHDHACPYLLADLFERHDRARFEVIAFSFGRPRDDAVRRRLVAGFDRFIDVPDRSDAEIAALARGIGIDVAIDLNGLADQPRAAMLAHRAAPVQASLLGYAGTTAAPWIDYVVADHHVIPDGQRDSFSEQVVRLPHSFYTFDGSHGIDAETPPRQALGLPEEGFVYCCFSSHYKIVPATFDGWMRILRAVPGSVLWLLGGPARSALQREAEARGVEGARLVFAPRLPVSAHLARHRAADLFIDTLPLNAHTTAIDALWAGLPVLTCTGTAFSSRIAGSLLHAIDMPQLVTDSQAEFEARAIAIGRDPSLARALKAELATRRDTTPLFDAALYARHLEAAFEAMHARRVAGLPPAHIDVSPSAPRGRMLET